MSSDVLGFISFLCHDEASSVIGSPYLGVVIGVRIVFARILMGSLVFMHPLDPETLHQLKQTFLGV